MKYGYDYIDGVKVPQMVVQSDFVIEGKHNGTVHVECGVLTIKGSLFGTLDVQKGSSVIIYGKQNGTVSVEDAALVIIYGELNGTTSIMPGGQITVEQSGKLAGTCNNEGTVVIAGVFGGAQSRSGRWVLEETGRIKQPQIKNGAYYYKW